MQFEKINDWTVYDTSECFTIHEAACLWTGYKIPFPLEFKDALIPHNQKYPDIDESMLPPEIRRVLTIFRKGLFDGKWRDGRFINIFP